MWYLVDSRKKRLYLKPDKETTFGRKRGDILIPNDESISRLHAAISVKSKDVYEVNEPTSTCIIKDLGSKYGTYILREEERIQVTEAEYSLKKNDKVRFGVQDNIFLVVNEPIIIVGSALSDNDKMKLQNLIHDIDAVIFPSWIRSCTHLTVTKATLTEKVTCAMANAIPIVTINYWEQVKLAVENNEIFPDSNNFIAPISESLINKQKVSLSPNEERPTLFKDLIFVHFSVQQYKTYGKIISLAGGKPVLYSKKHLTTEQLCAPNVIVLQYPSSELTQSTQTIAPDYDSIYNAIQANNRKMISESEIPLAILHCSTEKYCNPTFKFSQLLKRSEPKCDSSKVLVLDTQDQSPGVRILPQIISDLPIKTSLSIKSATQRMKIIPETCDDFSSSDLLNADSINQSENSLKSNESQTVEKTKDSIDVTRTQESDESVKVVCPKENVIYIPETNDSFFSEESSENVRSFTHSIENLETQQNTSTQNSELLKESIVANKGTPFIEIIDLSENENSELKGTRSNANNKNSNESSTQKKSYDSSERNNIGDSPEGKKIKLSVAHNVPPAKNGSENFRTSEIVEDNKKRSISYVSSNDCDSDEDLFVCAEKKIRSENLDTENTKQSRPNTSNTSVQEQRSSRNLSTYTSSFLRVNHCYKRFKKVYNMIPKKRITLNDMYVWNKNNTNTIC